MADVDTSDRAPVGHAQGGALSGIANLAGAAMSLALVAGLGIWGYQLLVRDVTGVPVVRALEGPMRVGPEDPGGDRAAHQGLSVNRVAAKGAAGGPADRLVLAPQAAPLTADDKSRSELVPAVVSSDSDGSGAAQPAVARSGEAAGEVLALARAASGSITPPAGPGPESIAVPDDLIAEALASGGPGMARSPRPTPRPSSLRTAAATRAPAAEAQAAKELNAADIAAGTRLVQLGAFDTPEVARAEWRRLDGRFGDYMAGKDRVIQRAQTGGKTFYRLRATNFADLGDARRFCAALVAKNAACIPVVRR